MTSDPTTIGMSTHGIITLPADRLRAGDGYDLAACVYIYMHTVILTPHSLTGSPSYLNNTCATFTYLSSARMVEHIRAICGGQDPCDGWPRGIPIRSWSVPSGWQDQAHGPARMVRLSVACSSQNRPYSHHAPPPPTYFTSILYSCTIPYSFVFRS